MERSIWERYRKEPNSGNARVTVKQTKIQTLITFVNWRFLLFVKRRKVWGWGAKRYKKL